MDSDFVCLSVVPVFVNAGVALLPAILAGLASLVSLLLRPKMLWRACTARPGLSSILVTCAAGIFGGLLWWMYLPAATNARRRPASHEADASPRGARRIDWAARAVEWLRQDRLAAAAAASEPPKAEIPSKPADGKMAKQGTPVIFGGGVLRNGYLGGGSPLGLSAAWEFPAAGSPAAEELEGAMFLASPVVVDDAVFAASCLLDVRRNYGTLFCIDAKSGAARWTLSTFKDAEGKEQDFKGFFSSPAISADGKSLIIGQGLHTDIDCELVCVDTKTGLLRWRTKTPLHLESSPAIDGDVVVVGAGAVESGEDHRATGHPGLVVAVEISSGKKLWEYEVKDPESPPAIADGVVYIGSGFNGKSVVALRLESDEEIAKQGTDRLLWRTSTPHPATGAVTLVGDILLIGCGNGDYVSGDPHPNGAVIALDQKTGREKWRVDMPDGVLGKIAVFGDRAIVPVRNGEVVAIDLKESGKTLWRNKVGGEKAVLSGPAFTDKWVYAVTQDGYLTVLDAETGSVRERHYLNAKDKPGEMGLCVSSPMVSAGRVYVGSETGGLRCFVGKETR